MKQEHPDYIRFIETHGYSKTAAETTKSLEDKISDLARKQVNIDCLCWAIAVALVFEACRWIFS